MHRWMPSLLLLVACESEQAVVAEMERGLYSSHAAIAVQLVTTEILFHTFDPPTATTTLRHPGGCGCPCIERIGDQPPFVQILDYAEAGCLPESGIVPASLAGHATVDWNGSVATVTLQDFEVGLDHPLTGSISGVPAEDVSEITIEADIEVGDWSAVLDGTTLVDQAGLVLEGDASVDGPYPGQVMLKGVELGWDDIPPPCPDPSTGKATITGDRHDIAIDYAEPGDGFVTVTRKNRVSESVDYCGYRTELF